MEAEAFFLLRYFSALAIYVDGHEGKVALHASSRCIVNFKPKSLTAGRAGHTAIGGSFTGRKSWVSVQRNFKRDSPRAEEGNVQLV